MPKNPCSAELIQAISTISAIAPRTLAQSRVFFDAIAVLSNDISAVAKDEGRQPLATVAGEIAKRGSTAAPKTLEDARAILSQLHDMAIVADSHVSGLDPATGAAKLTQPKSPLAQRLDAEKAGRTSVTASPTAPAAGSSHALVARLTEIRTDLATEAVAQITTTPVAPKIEIPSAPPTDDQLLATYATLTGGQRKAFFDLHSSALWRAHEKAARTRRQRS